MRAPLLSSANSFSKPSIRKHSLSSENLFSDYHHQLHLPQQEKQTFPFSPLPQSPSRKAHTSIYTCIGFIIFFFVITIAACLHCSSIDSPHIVNHASLRKDTATKAHPNFLNSSKATPALKGLGTVFIRGTKVMSELVVAHITEGTQIRDLQLFLRTLYRSGVVARADTVLLFAWNALPMSMVDVIHEENCRFHELLRTYMSGSSTANSSVSTTRVFSSNISISPFSISAYRKASAENELSTQPFWGVRLGNFLHDNRSDDATEQFVWGSVIGFDASELNPDDTLQGFFDHPPVMLRRWACYQMLLGMVRHRFKHVLLTDVSGVAILGDPFAAARRRGGLYLTLEDRPWGVLDAVELGVNLRSASNTNSSNGSARRGGTRNRISLLSASKIAAKKQSNAQVDVHQRVIGGRRRARRGAPVGGLYEHVYGKRMWSTLEEFEKTKKLVNSAAIVGGIHQVRGLANSMVTEIVKVALDRMNRDAFPDSVLLSYLLHKSSSVLGKRVLEHLHLLDNAESFVHSLSGSQQPSFFFKRSSKAAYAIIQGNSQSKRWATVAQVIRDDICGSHADVVVYGDCIHT